MLPNTSFWFSASPPSEKVTPGGSCTPASAFRTSVITSPVERACTFHSTFTTRSRSRWLITAGPRSECTFTTWPSGTVRGAVVVLPGTMSGSCRRSSARCRASGASRTTTSRVSPLGSTQSPASMPAKAGRSDCATCPTVSPSDPASPRSRSTVSSGRCPLLESEMSTAPGVFSTTARTCSAATLIAARSGPLDCSSNCFRPPPKSLVNTAIFTPPSCASWPRISAAICSAPSLRWPFGASLT